ncbi:MAG TPA: double zinc ribbon domain-containing protein, partial [Lysobacter sp.]
MHDPVNQTPTDGVDSLGRRLWRALWLPPCLACGEAGDDGLPICRPCRDALPFNRQACARCGLPLAVAADACGRCLRRPPPQARVAAVFLYRAPLHRLL